MPAMHLTVSINIQIAAIDIPYLAVLAVENERSATTRIVIKNDLYASAVFLACDSGAGNQKNPQEKGNCSETHNDFLVFRPVS
jgi:hypothetical protein